MIRRRCFSFSMELIRNEGSSYEFFFFRGKERSNFREEVSIIKFSENFQFSKFEKGTKLLEASISQSSKYLNPAKFNFTQLSILLRNKIEITSEKRRRRNFPFQVILLQQSFLFLFCLPVLKTVDRERNSNFARFHSPHPVPSILQERQRRVAFLFTYRAAGGEIENTFRSFFIFKRKVSPLHKPS